MSQNVGSTDQKLRTAAGAVTGTTSIAILAGAVSAPAALSPVLGLVAVIMLATAAVGTCPVYGLLGIDSCSRDSSPS
jgi:hypothetical protein